MKRFLLALIIFPLFTYAVEDDLILRGGAIIGAGFIDTSSNTSDTSTGFGISTSLMYKVGRKWEFGLGSEAVFGHTESLKLKLASNEMIEGEGHTQSVSITPQFKYITNYKVNGNWHFYTSMGPSWTLVSIQLDDFEDSNGEDLEGYKLTYDSRGAMLAFGFEEQLYYKEMKQSYIQFQVNYYRSRKVSLVDNSDSSKIEIIDQQEAKRDINIFIIGVSMGMIFF